MARYIAQVALQPKDALPKDVMENVWHFRTGAGAGVATAPGDGPDIVTKLTNFYTVAAGSAPALDAYLSSSLSEAVIVKVYDEDAVLKPRPIFYSGTFTLSAAGTAQALPEEVALCVSYYAGENQKRLRGRVYLGPFGSNANSTGDPAQTPSGSRPAINLIHSIAQAGEALLAASATGASWCLRSGIGAGTKAAPLVTYNVVTNGWVDNEWDAQRRRRIEATARTIFDATSSTDSGG
jgi:hypothetical protein